MKRMAGLVLLITVVMLMLSGCGCKHEHTEVRGAIEATCTQAGATGETWCLDCKKVVEKSKEIPALGHDEGVVREAYDASCAYEGYTGNLYCSRCGALLKEGESIPMIPHVPSEERSYSREPSCTYEGYTGDICCVNCGQVLEEGTSIPMLDHVPAEERSNALEATCTNEGYTGDVRCANCGTLLEEGAAIPMLEHELESREKVVEATCTREGYTGEGVCKLCENFIKGEKIPMLEHTFDANGVCTVCGWKTPGLYMDDQMVMTWDELVSNGYVTLYDETVLDQVGNGLTGMLVVGDGITELSYDCLNETQLSEIWLSPTVSCLDGSSLSNGNLEVVRVFGAITDMGQYVFSQNPSLRRVEFLNPVAAIGRYAFNSCPKLEEVILPEGLETLDYGVFMGCESLKAIRLPGTLTYLGEKVFYGCAALTQIELPEGLKRIDGYCFSNSGIVSITVPSTVEEITYGVFCEAYELTTADLSACQATVLEYPFSEDHKLTSISLPAGLTRLTELGKNCESLTYVDIPEGVTEFNLGYNNAISTVVWPVSLVDAGGFDRAGEAFTTVYYRGNEMRWNMISNKGEWADRVKVVCDYDGTLPPESQPEPTAEPEAEGAAAEENAEPEADSPWTCENGHEGNTGKFCPVCGAAKPE